MAEQHALPRDKTTALGATIHDALLLGMGITTAHVPAGNVYKDPSIPTRHPLADNLVFSPQLLQANRLPTCSDDELAEAILLGEWDIREDAGMVFTYSRYNGKIYLLDYKAAPL